MESRLPNPRPQDETRSPAQRFSDAVCDNLRSVGLENEADLSAAHHLNRQKLSPSELSSTVFAASTLDEDTDMTHVEDYDNACSTEDEEDGPTSPRTKRPRAASSVCSGTPPLSSWPNFPVDEFLLDADPQVTVYSDVHSFLADLASAGYGTPADASWRLNPVLGPATELARLDRAERSAMEVDSRDSPRPKPRNTHSASAPRIWLAIWSHLSSGRRLDLVLTKASAASPVVMASPLPLHIVPANVLSDLVQKVCVKLKSIFPPSLFTPGGSLRSSFLSPMNNIYACLGPAPLVQVFSQSWSDLCNREAGIGSGLPTLQGTLNAAAPAMTFRMRKVKLSHLPATFTPTSMPLMAGFAVRPANATDDLKAIAKLLRDYRVEINPARGESVSYDACLRDIDRAVQAGHVWVYEVSSKTMPGLRFYPGFLKACSETEGSIAITEFFTGAPWRKRGVAESLIREAVIHYLSAGRKKQVVCLLPDVAEAAARACARVGFRVLERSRWEEKPEGEDEGQRVRRTRPPSDTAAYLSWERWALARFPAVSSGTLWHQLH